MHEKRGQDRGVSEEPEPPKDEEKPRDFRQVVAIYAIAPVVTHVAATVAADVLQVLPTISPPVSRRRDNSTKL